MSIPEHISHTSWRRTLALGSRWPGDHGSSKDDISGCSRDGIRRLVGQLNATGPGLAPALFQGRSLEDLVAGGDCGFVMNVWDAWKLSELAVTNGLPPTIHMGDYEAGVSQAMPSNMTQVNSWNFPLIKKVAQNGRRQMVALSTSLTFSPVADACSSRSYGNFQGRAMEGGAIDSPRAQALRVAAHVEGLQGDLPGVASIAANLKHWAMYQTGNSDYQGCMHGERELLDTFAIPFIAGWNAGARTEMRSFVDFLRTPSHASRYLADFAERHGSMVHISDFAGIFQLIEAGVAVDEADACRIAFNEGRLHVDLNGGIYGNHLVPLVLRGTVSLHDLLVRVAEVLELKEWLGLYDHSLRGMTEDRSVWTAHDPDMLQLAKESVVLLTPQEVRTDLFPIPDTHDTTILVGGPIAESKLDTLGPWHAEADKPEYLEMVITTAQGLRNRFGEDRATYIPGFGCRGRSDEWSDLIVFAKGCTHIVLHIGETIDESGEASVLTRPRIDPSQVESVVAIRAAAPHAKIYVIIAAGRHLHIPQKLLDAGDAIMWAGHLRTYNGTAIAALLADDPVFTGRLAYSLPGSEHLHAGYSFRRVRTERPLHRAVPESYDEKRGEAAWSDGYIDYDGPLAQFHFGHGAGGLAKFELSDFAISGSTMSVAANEALTVSCTITNVGTRRGKETLFLLYHDVVAEVQPFWFEHINERQLWLDPGESQTVSFTITPNDLAQYGKDLSEGAKPRPDKGYVYPFIVQHSGQAEAVIGNRARMEEAMRFVLTP